MCLHNMIWRTKKVNLIKSFPTPSDTQWETKETSFCTLGNNVTDSQKQQGNWRHWWCIVHIKWVLIFKGLAVRNPKWGRTCTLMVEFTFWLLLAMELTSVKDMLVKINLKTPNPFKFYINFISREEISSVIWLTSLVIKNNPLHTNTAAITILLMP